MTKPHPWIRHPRLDRVELYFPYDADLLTSFKALIPYQNRQWHDGPDEKFWSVGGELWCSKAEQWFEVNCGRGKEIAKGQLEMAL